MNNISLQVYRKCQRSAAVIVCKPKIQAYKISENWPGIYSKRHSFSVDLHFMI